ncbi:unnamed protein product [Didymodactylos carnosus]|uniref:PH domain-containing protein n=1 Tax=Didymodactylos carnosus TaxID=1234261 RepID=A0A813QT92_9BILA|nr:unnamed protein product [Didymodactylos carnosus]CAF1303954.1 unnamed protein product [Didymodactylos carnosus]CAF3554850.1 unnamed protein product [Didymodactylos carnosus]CAF4110536.1 unnamed protein product [Didymodactylos carnosus]
MVCICSRCRLYFHGIQLTTQCQLLKFTNLIKGWQMRNFFLDTNAKVLLYFMPEEVRKKPPRGVIELTDAWVSPSTEDDITFTVQTSSGETFKLRASDAKERQKWIDRLRSNTGANAAETYASSLPPQKVVNSVPTNNDSLPRSTRRDSSVHHYQTLKELKEVIRCTDASQREFVETVETIPDSLRLNLLSKEMLLLRSTSQSCVTTLQESLAILTNRRLVELKTPEPDFVPPPSPSPQPPLVAKQLSQSYGGKTGISLSTPPPSMPLNKTSSLTGLNQPTNEQSSIFLPTKSLKCKCSTIIMLRIH